MKKFKKWVAWLLRNWAYKLDPVLEYDATIHCQSYKEISLERIAVAHVCNPGEIIFSPTQITDRLINMMTDSMLRKGAIRFSAEQDMYGGMRYIATSYVRTDWDEEGNVS